MSQIKSCIGYMKAIQRAIGSETAERLFTGDLHENSAEFRAHQLMYEFSTHLRYLLQLAEDEDWVQIIASQEEKPPEVPKRG